MNIFAFCAIYGFASLKSKWSSIPLHSVFTIYVLLFASVSVGDAQFLVDVVEKTYGGWQLVHRCEARGANFGVDVPSFSYRSNMTGCVSLTSPQNACVSVLKPPNITGCKDFYAFVPRGYCAFSVKAYQVQLAQFRALIVYSNPGDQPIPMDGSTYKELIRIPVVMVSYNCMDRIMESYRPENGYKIAIRAIPGYYDLVKYLIPFVGVVALCFVVLFLSLLFRVFRERRRIARKRLSKRNLKKLPTRKYKKGESVETCAICLEDFIEGEKLRILPCNHVYHCKCVDPWLTKNRKVCPICKRKVCSSGDSDSSDSEAERNNTAGTSSSNTHENAPLIDNEMLFTSVPLGTSSYLDDRGSYVVNINESENDQASTSHDMPTTSASGSMIQNSSEYAEDSPYLDTVVTAATVDFPRNSSSFPAVLRQKFRPLVQGLVNKASRVARKDEKLLGDVSQLDAGELEGAKNFSAENEAFDGSLESHNNKRVSLSPHGDTGSVYTSPTVVEVDSNDESMYFSANDQSLPFESRSGCINSEETVSEADSTLQIDTDTSEISSSTAENSPGRRE